MRARDILCSIVGGVAIFVACGRGETPASADTPEGFADGSRIKARWTTVVFADGAKGRTFAGWWDSERKEECTPTTLSVETTGAGWCLPSTIVPLIAIFGDATCSTPIAAQPIGGLKPGLVGSFADIPRKLWTVGEPLAAPADVWVKDSGACVARTWSGTGAMRVSPADLGRFAAVTISAP